MGIATTVYPKGDKGILIPQRPTTGEQDTYITIGSGNTTASLPLNPLVAFIYISLYSKHKRFSVTLHNPNQCRSTSNICSNPLSDNFLSQIRGNAMLPAHKLPRMPPLHPMRSGCAPAQDTGSNNSPTVSTG